MVPIERSPDVEASRALFAEEIAGVGHRSAADLLASMTAKLLDGHRRRHPGAAPSIRCWCLDRIGWDEDAIHDAEFDLAMARQTMVREFGFGSWSEVESAPEPDLAFEAAVDCLLEGEFDDLRARLDESPDLAAGRSHFGHRATLLHYAAANGVETWRQVTPHDLADRVSLLLEAGADLSVEAKMYGGSTFEQLLVTSAHPRAAGVVQPTLAVVTRGGATDPEEGVAWR